MPAVVVVGMQWGDEGKGKVIDFLAEGAAWTVRFQGGANAGHTIHFGGARFALHLLPSGAVRAGVRCGLGWGMVIDPGRLLEEIEALEARGISVRDRILVSGRATLLLPHHAARDRAEEAARTGTPIGTTGRGIGPAYESRAARAALLLADLAEPDGEEKLRIVHESTNERLSASGAEPIAWEPLLASWRRWRAEIVPLLGDLSGAIEVALARGERVLFEGAQGTHLDLYAGTYPFVTSSSTLAAGACAGCGIGPTRIERVIGVAKAYATRVGAGPFPTEATAEEGARLRERGSERGTTTGRPRRCGWLDIPMLRAAVRWNGISGIALTKADVLSGRKTVPVAVAYDLDGERIAHPPLSPSALARVRPVFEEWPGWETIPPNASRVEDLPPNLVRYAERIASSVGAPIVLLSTGPAREQTVACSVGTPPR
ncbi:MAG: adenylosuccinate synthase [Candidatus Eisenbacteria bacterium]|nr:adenylosuccinate synthase [Candidatus Eisenbacteria bacterium]